MYRSKSIYDDFGDFGNYGDEATVMNQTFTLANLFTSPQDMIVILVIALLVFGPKKLPEVGRQIGSALRELNKMRGDVQRALDLDQFTRFDHLPDYHAPKYGPTYPALGGNEYASDVHGGDAPVATAEVNDTYSNRDAAFAHGTSVAVAPPGPRILQNVATAETHTVLSEHRTEAELLPHVKES